MIVRLLQWLPVIWPLCILAAAYGWPGLLRRFIGWRTYDSLEGQYGVGDPRASRELESMGRALSAATSHPGARFRLLRGETLNAVALSDGTICVWEGLYRLVRDHPDELAGVLAHELGHLECDHFLQRVRFGYVVQAVFFWIGRGWAALLARRLVSEILTSGYSRAQEREADAEAVRILLKSGRTADGLADLLEKLDRVAGSAGSRSSILGTHPAGRERAESIRSQIQRVRVQCGSDELPPAEAQVQARQCEAAAIQEAEPKDAIGVAHQSRISGQR